MPAGDVLAALLVQLAAVGVALYGVRRCFRLQRFGADRRLQFLAWFFGLFAAAVLLNAAWQLHNGLAPPRPDDLDFRRFGNTSNLSGPPSRGGGGPFDRGLFRPEGAERADLWLAGHHALMLSSLVVGVWAFGHRRKEAATVSAMAIGLGAVGDLVPTMLALEAGLTLYLAVRAYLNHVQVRSAGAMQVALGFFLFFVAHLLFYLWHQPGMARAALGDVLNLVGIILLVQVLPGKE